MKKINYEMVAEIAADCWLPCLICTFMCGGEDKNWLYYVLYMAVLVIPIIVVVCKLKEQ